MISAIIIEDELNAARFLMTTLRDIAPDIEVQAVLGTVSESIEYLSAGHRVDIIFSDVQLKDGVSFAIFDRIASDIPVIFITAFDSFMVHAFECNGIDYMLKPVSREELEQAIGKYRRLEKHFSMKLALNRLNEYIGRKKSRYIVRKGAENYFLQLSDIVLFYTSNDVSYAIDKDGMKYLVDKNLGEIQRELDSARFFRANRQYILNIDYIKAFRTYEKVKLQVDLTISINHSIIISQNTALQFRQWLYNA